ncbi:MAG: septum formation initiator family protein [Candidatus Zapsychrus exili]|nr:septum formation initiator family protein [Candidatus Zapsychrus exili]
MKSPIVIFIFAFLILAVFIPSYFVMCNKKARIAEYEKQIQRLKIKNVELAEERRKLEDDPVYLEKVAREKMGIVREGETIYRLEDVEE